VTDQANTDGQGGADVGAITPQTIEALVAQQQASEAQRDAARLTDFLASSGLPSTDPVGAEVNDYVTGKRSISPELRAQVQAKVDSWGKDREFMRKLFDGSAEEKRLLTVASAMLMAPLEEVKS
jgi:hypothetical protein